MVIELKKLRDNRYIGYLKYGNTLIHAVIGDPVDVVTELKTRSDELYFV